MEPVLRVAQLTCGYGGIPVLHGIDLEVGAGEVVALLGANGAGKTTTLLAIAGELPITEGSVHIVGRPAVGPLQRRVRSGLGLVTEERSVFMRLSVLDNLRVGRVHPSECFQAFPELESRSKTLAGDLSGGEQQMLTLARALAREPKILLADELSLGLAPLVVDRLLKAVRAATLRAGVGALIVEQHLGEVLAYADRVYVMVRGGIKYSGTARDFKARRADIEALYLGSSAAGS